jgi:hypothetical protein
MFITAIIAVFVILTILFSFIRAVAGKYRVHPFDWISMLFAGSITFLLVYYNVI